MARKLRYRLARAKAEQIIPRVIEQARKINANDELLNTVHQVWIFGSYLTDARTLGDIDLAVELRRKLPGDEYIDASIERAKLLGALSLDWAEQTYFAEHEILRLIKKVSRYINVHEMSEVNAMGGPYRVLFREEEGQINGG